MILQVEITERIEGNPFTAWKDLDIGFGDAVVRRMPELEGLVLYAGVRDDMTELLERVKGKALMALSWHLDFDMAEYYLEPHRYDIILSLNVLEGLMNPRYYLEQLRGALRRDGRLILTTTPLRWFITPEQFYQFDEKRLRLLLAICGFKVVVMEKLKQSIWRGPKWWWYVEVKK